MVYRINICVEDGTIVGRQDRELDETLFGAIITGQRPQADGEAHTRDHPENGGSYRTCYYHSIWNPDIMQWQADATAEQVAELYTSCAREAFGG